MVGYRRNFIPGGTYFFTATLHNRQSTYLIDHVEALHESIQKVKNITPFDEIARVILPDHIHVIWKLPEKDFDYPARWKAIKSMFTRYLVKAGEPIVKNARGEYLLWQRRYWEHTIMNDQDLQSHIDYVHYNPVKHGYVNSVNNWVHSSFHEYVRSGLLPEDWSGAVNEIVGMNFGE
jgi:putative transposase